MHRPTVIELASPALMRNTGHVSQSVEILARLHHGELVRVLKARLRSEEDAADLAQEAYARLLRYPELPAVDAELRRVLFRIAENLLTDHWRWRQVRRNDVPVTLEALDVESSAPSHDRQIAAQQQMSQLERFIMGMPDKRREVFVLSRIHGLTNAEVAAQCGISLKMVEKHLALAMADCRAYAQQHSLEAL